MTFLLFIHQIFNFLIHHYLNVQVALQQNFKCPIPNSPVTTYISLPFRIVKYKFDNNEWYKDEGGKPNFLSFELGLHKHNSKYNEYIKASVKNQLI